MVKWLALAAAAAFAGGVAIADDEVEVRVTPLDPKGSPEQQREGAGSGFDEHGAFGIDPKDFERGARDDGTFRPPIPDPPPPTPDREERTPERGQ